MLEGFVDGFDADTGSTLGHGKDVDDTDCIFIDKFSEHETHDFHRHSRPGMFQHLPLVNQRALTKDTSGRKRSGYFEQRERGDVDDL